MHLLKCNIDLNLKDDNNSSNWKDNNQNDEYDYDEIKQYINTRYLCPTEAMHRLLEYVLHETSHTIKRLAVHDENAQEVYFKEGQENGILNKNFENTLTAYFKLYQIDSEARNYIYCEIPIHYTFDEKLKTWNRRKKN